MIKVELFPAGNKDAKIDTQIVGENADYIMVELKQAISGVRKMIEAEYDGEELVTLRRMLLNVLLGQLGEIAKEKSHTSYYDVQEIDELKMLLYRARKKGLSIDDIYEFLEERFGVERSRDND